MREELYATAPVSRASTGVLVFAAAFQAFLLANLVSFDYGRDQGIYAVVGRAIMHGGVPYREVWDFKPPGIHFLFALARAILGPAPWAIRVIEAACWATVPLCFARFVARHGGNPLLGVLGGVLATYIEVRAEYWHTAQPESFGGVFLVWALTLVTTAGKTLVVERDLWRWGLAGLLFGAAGLLKPPLGAGLIPLFAVWLVDRMGGLEAGRRVRPIGALVLAALVGAAAPVAITLAFFVRRHGLGDLTDVLFRFTPHYTALGGGLRRVPANILRATLELLAYFSPMLAVAPLAFTALLDAKRREQIGVRSVAAIAFFPWLGIALQAKFFPYHYEGCLPFVCLLAVAVYARAVDWLERRGPRPMVRRAAVLLVVCGFCAFGEYINPKSFFWDRVSMRLDALAHPARREQLQDAMTSEGDVRSVENRRLSDWLRATTTASASVFIWGFEPVVYDSSRRRCASRYVYNVAQRLSWSHEASCATLKRDLEADPPVAVAVESEDRFADVTGNTQDSAEAIAACAWFPAWLSGNYSREWASAKFTVYRRTEPGPEDARPRSPARTE
jgi:4-amino-4-deoxy-L-arabinose transferase-like glycosyltransferase